MKNLLRVLFIEDSDDDTALLVRLLTHGGYQVEYQRVDSLASLQPIVERSWDLIVSDFSMPHFSGTDALKFIRTMGLDTPFIFVSGTIGEETAVEALKVGAQDYLMKTSLGRFVPAVQRELREAEERRERKRLEKQVQQLQRFEAIGRLAGGVAHDFNNVVSAIMGWAEMGFADSRADTLDRERFLKIRLQADRAAALTRQLLAFARRQILQPRSTGLNDLIRDEVSLLKNIIGAQNTIHMNLADDLRPIWADPGQVEQVIMNLCLNARDAMPDGGSLTISTDNVDIDDRDDRMPHYVAPGEYALLTVSDTGVGIDPAVLDHIFEPFFTTKSEGKGTGLGLSTVYGIVKQHKGFIDVTPAPESGTAFHVYLPVAHTPAVAMRPARETGPKGGTETILLAEDDDDVRETASKILKNLGYQVLAARNGAEAVRLFAEVQGSVDLVLLDIVMPVLNGPDASKRMAALKPGVRLLFATGYATESHLVAVRSLPNATILQKPYDTGRLAEKVREVLDRKPT